MKALPKTPSLTTYLRQAEWMQLLEPELAAFVEERALERVVEAGSSVYIRGAEPKFWVGVIDGLLLMSTNSGSGKTTSVSPVHSGEWIGEASLLFLKQRQFDLVALRSSRLACISRDAFRHLFDTSIPFNHYLIRKLAKRVGYLAKLLSSDRLLTPVERVSSCLAGVWDSQGKGASRRISMTQIEAARLTGLSRQHVNKALHQLKKRGLISIERGGVQVLDIGGLRKLLS